MGPGAWEHAFDYATRRTSPKKYHILAKISSKVRTCFSMRFRQKYDTSVGPGAWEHAFDYATRRTSQKKYHILAKISSKVRMSVFNEIFDKNMIH